MAPRTSWSSRSGASTDAASPCPRPHFWFCNRPTTVSFFRNKEDLLKRFGIKIRQSDWDETVKKYCDSAGQ